MNKTKLITIDYEEYLDLIRIKNNCQREIFIQLIKELNKIPDILDGCTPISTNDIKQAIRSLTNFIDTKIMEIEKEGENNDN